MIRIDSWSPVEDARLIALVLAYTEQGKRIKDAAEHFSAEVQGHRTAAAAQTRWVHELAPVFRAEYEEAKNKGLSRVIKIDSQPIGQYTKEGVLQWLQSIEVDSAELEETQSENDEMKQRLADLQMQLDAAMVQVEKYHDELESERQINKELSSEYMKVDSVLTETFRKLYGNDVVESKRYVVRNGLVELQEA